MLGKRKRQRNRLIALHYNVINELSFFIKSSPQVEHDQTIDRLIVLRARIGESVQAIREDRKFNG